MRVNFRRKKAAKDHLKESLAAKTKIDAPCPHFSDCGGCDLQNYSYEDQVDAKLSSYKGQVEDKKLTKIFKDIEITSMASPRQTGYRQKMDFVCAFEKSGLRGSSFDSVIELENCMLLEEESFTAYKRALELAKEHELEFYNYKSHYGFLRYITVRRTRLGEQIVSFLTSSTENEDKLDKIANTLMEESLIDSFIWQVFEGKTDSSFGSQQKFWGKELIEEEMLGYKFKLSTNTFFQANQEIATEAYRMIKDHAAAQKPKEILDLYSGTCTIGISLSDVANKVVAIENFAPNRDMALLNFENNNVSNIEYIDKDVNDFMQECTLSPDYVVCNPPRTGVDERPLRKLVEIKPKAISYLSCNPKTLLDDLSILSLHYKMDKAVVLDMFPQTKHFETLVQMTLK
ncbi:MAG: 23S rRNA (uracil(1939)-C(5))-methyltransferase RlmD [Lentisphaeraceae bacterium]|nr:23S rRNA (uracil(1939)-C(5))-methyltransferase RlmD [Lentisphaeraceae bacterium]